MTSLILVPVSGGNAPTALENLSPGRMPLCERPVLIGCHRPVLAFGPDLFRSSQNLIRGFGLGSLSPISHVSLSHEVTMPSFLYPRG